MEEVAYPTYVTRNPANTRVQAGLPAPARSAAPRRPTTSDTTTRDLGAEVRPATETEVIEDVYDE